mmetsp:Transcript_18175/g.36666  ORF Transcript_18175/g.36666 Transcript_18175/m.36666 type:complete len:95 (-) Transcript_18175:3663-3947(-)
MMVLRALATGDAWETCDCKLFFRRSRNANGLGFTLPPKHPTQVLLTTTSQFCTRAAIRSVRLNVVVSTYAADLLLVTMRVLLCTLSAAPSQTAR